jgi:hypothetical protein
VIGVVQRADPGIGGSGYLETSTKRLKIYSPSEIVDYSVSAMSVGPDDIWMGLFWFGEGGFPGAGLLKFDGRWRVAEAVVH